MLQSSGDFIKLTKFGPERLPPGGITVMAIAEKPAVTFQMSLAKRVVGSCCSALRIANCGAQGGAKASFFAVLGHAIICINESA